MLKNAFQPQNRLYSGCILIFLLLTATALTLFGLAGLRAWNAQQVFEQERDQFQAQYRLWQEHQISSYSVTYNNCNYLFCCNEAVLMVQEGVRDSLTPTCDQVTGGYTYYGDTQVRTMDELFQWVDSQYDWGSWEKLEIEYHPEQHYITKLVWVSWQGAAPIEITYSNLQESE